MFLALLLALLLIFEPGQPRIEKTDFSLVWKVKKNALQRGKPPRAQADTLSDAEPASDPEKADDEGDEGAVKYLWDAGPVPDGAVVTLELDRSEYFLGENVLLHYVLENVGTETFEIAYAENLTAIRQDSYTVTVTNENGVKCLDPYPPRSVNIFTGPCGKSSIVPGEKRRTSLQLIRFCFIDEPGTYTIRVDHGFGWRGSEEELQKLSSGEAVVTFNIPSAQQAREVVQQMDRLKEEESWSYGERREPYADYRALRYPVYLDILLDRAYRGDEKALDGIGAIPSFSATQALIDLLGHRDRKFALSVARTLNMRLPDPMLTGELPGRNIFEFGYVDLRAYLVEKSWDDSLAPFVRAFAGKALLEKDLEWLECGAFMLQCVGEKEDLPVLARGLDTMVYHFLETEPATKYYPQPRSIVKELLRAARVLFKRGASPRQTNFSCGDQVLFALAIGENDQFRPEEWQYTCKRMLEDSHPYLRETMLDHLPAQMSTEVFRWEIQRLLDDNNKQVCIAALHCAGRNQDSRLLESVLKVVHATSDEDILRAATNAAWQLDAKHQCAKILASRLDELDVALPALNYLTGYALNDHGGSRGPPRTETVAVELKSKWLSFLSTHKERLIAGKRFKIGSPEVTRDLFPPGYTFSLDDGKTWPSDE